MGNGFKVWHYSGALLHETAWPAGQELLQVIWQKYDENVFKEKPISNVKVQGIEPSQPQSSATKYVPIHLRGGAPSVLGSSPKSGSYQPERGPIPGLPVGYKVSQGQRKKERNTKRKDSENAAKPAGANANTNTNSNANEESDGKPARAPQNASTAAPSNNKQRNNQRTPKPSNNQNHSIGNGANANNQSQNNGNDSNAKADPSTDPNVSGSAANDQSNTDSDEARKAKRDSRHRNRQRKSESGSATSGDAEKDKRIRIVQQKLKDISKLKVRRENGENLEANQLSKIKMEAELVKELSALKVES